MLLAGYSLWVGGRWLIGVDGLVGVPWSLVCDAGIVVRGYGLEVWLF
jgi:hypothetical protein